jgi:hypothetical protein
MTRNDDRPEWMKALLPKTAEEARIAREAAQANERRIQGNLNRR